MAGVPGIDHRLDAEERGIPRLVFPSDLDKGAETKQLQRNRSAGNVPKLGRRTYATVVDHIKPHRGDWGLFTDENNLQSLCEHHHGRKRWRNNSNCAAKPAQNEAYKLPKPSYMRQCRRGYTCSHAQVPARALSGLTLPPLAENRERGCRKPRGLSNVRKIPRWR